MIGLRSRRGCQISGNSGAEMVGTSGNDAWSDWWSWRCRLSSLTERRTVARIRSSHSEVLRATSFREEKERLDGIHQISPSTGIAIKSLRFEKVPSFSLKYSFFVTGTLRYVHLHTRTRTRTRTRTGTRTGSHNPYIRNRLSFSRWSLHVTQAEHRRDSKARGRRAACSTREEIIVDRSNFFVSLHVRWENRNGCASNVNPRERIVGVAVFVFSKLIRTTAISSKLFIGYRATPRTTLFCSERRRRLVTAGSRLRYNLTAVCFCAKTRENVDCRHEHPYVRRV